MIRQWLAARRSLVATLTSGTVVVALITTAAVVSGGYSAKRLDLGDGAVWVTNETRQVVGRANTAVRELNTVVTAGSASLDLVQQGSTVLVIDRADSSVAILDAATAKVAETVPLPPVNPAVFLTGGKAVIASDGDMWSLPTAELGDFESATEPTFAFGSGSVVSMDAAGVFYSFAPATGDLSRVDTATGDTVVSTVKVAAGEPDDRYQLTSVNGMWALLNQSSGHLFLPGHDVDVSDELRASDVPLLQQASLAGSRVLIGHRGGLLAVPLSGGKPIQLVTGRSGRPAAPVSVESCSYAAWGDATVWRACAEDAPEGRTDTLDGVAGDARLEFRSNGDALLLNDAHNGSVWAAQQDNALIDNWDELIDNVSNEQRVEENTDDNPPELEKTRMSPVALDDDFGARPGRTVTLPVLLNDYDPNGDVLVITELTELPRERGRLDLVENNQQVQLTLPPTASGELKFGYTINDGRGGQASATVTVSVRADEENSPPEQIRATRVVVKAGGTVTSHVLGDWVDPDGDAFYLTRVSARAPDQVGFSPGGTVVYTDAGTSDDLKKIGLAVSDGREEGTGTLTVTTRPSGSVPIIADSFVALALAGDEITVSPLGHVRGGSGPLRLSSVPARPGVTITPDFDGGTFRFTSSVAGINYIEYAVTDGKLTAKGMVRVDVANPGTDTAPVTVPHTAFIRGQRATRIDVLATDIDPAGGVLLVTGTMNVPPASGLRVEILDQHVLRVTLTKPLENGSARFNYRVSNGVADAEGTVNVIELPERARKQAPIAMPDTVAVRVGDAIDIPVLGNDRHPDDDALSLDPQLATGLPPDAGLLFTSGRVLRYLAPHKTGNFAAVYRVNAPDGQFANAEVRISVREADPASNAPPVPKALTARVLAGDTVRIPIPLSGIDPDGDSVQLLGQETNPVKGAVTQTGTDSIEYTSGEYSTGTDSFTYTVVDALGARASGIVRVGISPRLNGARNPIAAPDEVVVRPGTTVAVRVLGNDSNPDGGALRIVGVEPTGGPGKTQTGEARLDGDTISVTAPQTEGRFGFIYEIQNERGGTSSNFLTVVVQNDAPRSRPDAEDTVLSLSDVQGRTALDVDVLAHVFFADGSVRNLDLTVLGGFASTAKVTKSKRIRVAIADNSQIIPFAVRHPDDPDIVSYAFIWVPGFNDALPQLRTGAPKLSVPSEAALRIDINDYVVAASGKSVKLTDRSTVRATHANGQALASTDSQLIFTSADKYYGPASISFEVTDGSSATDPAGRTATIVLPVIVTPRDNQPPAFAGALIDLEPDQTKVIDLRKLTAYPYPDDQQELAYTVLAPEPVGFTWSLSGDQLTLRAAEATPRGQRGAITIGVRDDINQGKAGRIEMHVVASTRPLATPAADTAVAPRGATTVIDVLANDGATNPFPAVPLRVVAVRGADRSALPSGVTITRGADNSRLTVKVSADAEPVDTNVQYQVADATGDPDRYAWGAVRISVQDKPDPVTNLHLDSFGDRRLSVSFNAGAFNNSAITGYEVALLEPDSGDVLSKIVCESTTCDIRTPGNGRANSVRVAVAARNAIGLSARIVLADPVWSDVVPAAPAGLSFAPLDGGLRLSWESVGSSGGGSAVRSYVVTVGGMPESQVSATGPACGASSCSVDIAGLTNGTKVAYSVSARNDSYPALSTWNSSQGEGTAFGAPRAGGITATSSDAEGSVTVNWDAFDGNGEPVDGYYVQLLAGTTIPTGAQACSVTTPAPGAVNAPKQGGTVAGQKGVSAGTTSATFENLTAPNTSYAFVVWGYNQAGCAPTAVTSALVRAAPGPVSTMQGAMAMRGTAWDFQLAGPSQKFDHYRIRTAAADEIGVRFDGTGWPRDILDQPFGSTVTFQVTGCAIWDKSDGRPGEACGPWSDQSAPEPSLSLAVDGLRYNAETRVLSWTNGPANGGLPASYQCSVPGDPTAAATDADSPTSCTLPEPAPSAGTVRLTVTVNGHGYNHDLPVPTEENLQ